VASWRFPRALAARVPRTRRSATEPGLHAGTGNARSPAAGGPIVQTEPSPRDTPRARSARAWRIPVAALAGGAFGLASVTAGLRVLTGLDTPGYVVLPWLVRYNVAAGLAAIVVAVALWQRDRHAAGAAAGLAAMHALVLGVLVAMRLGGATVAIDSLAAMALRTVVWAGVALAARPPRLA